MNRHTSMPRAFIAFSLALSLVFLSGCANTKNPVEGWTPDGESGYVGETGSFEAYIKTIPYGKTIQEDVQKFADNMPIHKGRFADRRESYWIDHVSLFRNDDSQRAVMIRIPLDGDWTNYVLFYDSHGTRIRVVKWISGHYRS